MTMHQILKIDERISFLTKSVEIGEKYLTPKNQQMVQWLNRHGTKSIYVPKTSLLLFPLPNHGFLNHHKTLPCSPRDEPVKQINVKPNLQLLEQPGTNRNYSDSREYTFLYFARPRFGTFASYHLASWPSFVKYLVQGFKLGITFGRALTIKSLHPDRSNKINLIFGGSLTVQVKVVFDSLKIVKRQEGARNHGKINKLKLGSLEPQTNGYLNYETVRNLGKKFGKKKCLHRSL